MGLQVLMQQTGKALAWTPKWARRKSKWKEGKTGVNETQEAWQKGQELRNGTIVWNSGGELGTDGQTGVRVHIDGSGNINGYPVHPEQRHFYV